MRAGRDLLARAPVRRRLRATGACRVEWAGADRSGKVVALFTARSGKNWSFTDCLSFVVMKELCLQRALAADERFERAGFVRLLAR